ncbi:hypothetical protein BV22DRAFT_1043022 [Leucogyrophana mollusca]|uniref:Uncharacterized protein n=1 Tax=Leucogyrophana mollusca TaxID=85980 RepID=A0ACB8C128_9AGAM|nr:hypothetical protein BV22DRAFT_1043022 [Leucogyrophana mollusca]
MEAPHAKMMSISAILNPCCSPKLASPKKKNVLPADSRTYIRPPVQSTAHWPETSCHRSDAQRTPKSAQIPRNTLPSFPVSPAGQLLSEARQFAALESERFGHRPAIMDIILDCRLTVLSSKNTTAIPVRQGYVFRDSADLDAYWSDQAAIRRRSGVPWAAQRTIGLEISAERSTSSWPPYLDGESSCLSHGLGRWPTQDVE